MFQAEIVRQAPPERAGAVTGGVSVPVYGGVIVGPAAFSLAFALAGNYATTFAVVVAFAVAGVVSFTLAGGRPRSAR